MIVNEPAFQALSPEDQEIILTSADETDVLHAEHVKQNQAKVREALTNDHGVTFCELQDPEVWAERARGAWPQLYDLVGGGKEWVDMTLTYKETGRF